MKKIAIPLVMEYQDVFTNEPNIEIVETLKQFSRFQLVHYAALLSSHYGNMTIYDLKHTFFSKASTIHINKISTLITSYQERKQMDDQHIFFSTYRTCLELWRVIFTIKTVDYLNTITDENIEYTLFKVILALNEKVMFIQGLNRSFKIDELSFLSSYLTNDTNNYDFQFTILPQLHYFCEFKQAIQHDQSLAYLANKLLEKWGITSWQQYYTTLLWIAHLLNQYQTHRHKGVFSFNPKEIARTDTTGLFSWQLIDSLSIEIDSDDFVDNNNIDYREFRSKPFVKLNTTSNYLVINIEFVCERIFNSLYFDLLPLIREQKSSYNFNKDFIEKHLFQKTFFNCIKTFTYTYPQRGNIIVKEDDHEPDFYCRFGHKLLLIECKAIKMNGDIRDLGDYMRLLEELHEKLVLKTKKINTQTILNTPIPVGIGQIIHHIKSIEADEFKWDKEIPDDVRYYPMLVFEDTRLLQPGLLSILNNWLHEELNRLNLTSISYSPLVAVSINTLFLYDDLIKKRGITNLIDEFWSDRILESKEMLPTADFDYYLRKHKFNKRKYVTNMLIPSYNR